jgi:hypothetical protein
MKMAASLERPVTRHFCAQMRLMTHAPRRSSGLLEVTSLPKKSYINTNGTGFRTLRPKKLATGIPYVSLPTITS